MAVIEFKFYRAISPGPVHEFQFGSQTLAPQGLDGAEFGTHIAGHVVVASGTDFAEIGSHALSVHINPTGTDFAEFGSHEAINQHRTIVQNSIGLDVAEIGQNTEVGFGDQELFPPGIDGAQFGVNTWVSNFERYLQPLGFDGATVFDDYGPWDVSTGRAGGVYLDGLEINAGSVDGAEFGNAIVALDLDQFLFPTSLDSGAIGSHTASHT